MSANEIALLAKATQDGSMPFPEIVGKLIANGVEYYTWTMPPAHSPSTALQELPF